MKELTLPIELANAIMAYLGSRPYTEVASLIAQVQQVAQAQAVAQAAPPADSGD